MSIKDQIIQFLEKNPGWHTPTQIGMGIGKPYNSASSSVSQPLKNLEAVGTVERQVRVPYRVLYRIII